MKSWKLLAALGAFTGMSGIAQAQEWYAGGSVGYVQQNDSENSGSTGAFTTGNGAPAVPFGTAIAEGTSYGWTTEFSEGYELAGEFGARYGNGLRSGIELVYNQSDVDTHQGVTLGGDPIGTVDAAVLTGSETQLGATVADVVAEGRGELSNTGLFANVYYDFNRAGNVQPYVGGGIGYMWSDVQYEPSGVGIIDDTESGFAYQLKAGGTLRVTDAWEVYGEYAYRASEDVELDNQLFPGSLEVENEQNVFSIGARYRFGA